MQLVKSLSVS